MKVDAIINIANTALRGSSGVDGAIHRAAGPELLEEYRRLGGCTRGFSKITKAYRLPSKYVIHTVGPAWQGGNHGEFDVLASCYRSSLQLAQEYHCETVAFPLISSEVYGYPKDQALNVTTETIRQFLEDCDITVYLVLFGQESFEIGRELFDDIAAYIDQRYAEIRAYYTSSQYFRCPDFPPGIWEELLCKAEMVRLSPEIWEMFQKEVVASGLSSEEWERFLGETKVAERVAELHPEMIEYFLKYFLQELNAFTESYTCIAAAPNCISSFQVMDDLGKALRTIDEGFSKTLLRLIDQRGMTDAQCYKKANIDRKLFSKIRNNPSYRPSKATALAFAVALELSLNETKEFLRKAGFALSRSSKFDIIVEYFISQKCYDVIRINEALFAFDQSLLGS